MIEHAAFPVEPWRLRETRLDLSTLAQTESLFALSNGHIGLRASKLKHKPLPLHSMAPRQSVRTVTGI